MVMKVKTKIMLFLVSMLMLGIVLTGCGEISILPKEVQIELGEEVPSNVSDYIYIEPHMLEKIQSNVELDVSGIDSMTVGNIVSANEVPCQEENQNDRSYDSFLDFPYEMTYVDEEAYQYIQKIYTNIDWYSEFETGDVTQYDFYKEKYKELINGQKPFFNPETGTEMYLNDFRSIENKSIDNYYFFDMDKDNAPEICLQSEESISIFKYDIDKEQFWLWKYIEQGHYALNGSLAMRWDNGSGAVFYNLDQKGKEICSVSFMIRNAYNEMIGPRYLVSLPRYAETDKNEYDKNILEQGYYDRGQSIYYFRVTETQYDELIKDYEKAYETAKYGLQNVTYSYGELFGE